MEYYQILSFRYLFKNYVYATKVKQLKNHQSLFLLVSTGLLRLQLTSNMEFVQGHDIFIPSFTSLREKINSTGSPEAASPFILCKQLLAAAEACEVTLLLVLSDSVNPS